ncbi:Glutathione transferase GST 23 [Cinnamomum micranthum f. kanehirae]|uniref:glutathione transferase n=1 Tax=Cinnamomum micranthum f. kanehirae TaxID=337451 RepID=A0A443NB66_9MAGN|nr:Glutathione transferase GST 23 [Cinnamomum micranthum f. kanehirae]
MGEVKVIGSFPSLFSYRVQWALKLKGIEFEYLVEDLLNKSPMLLKYNPVHKKVPVLVHNGKAIVESLVILEYIDETWKENPLLPQDPHERAMARFWAKFADEKCLFGGVWSAFCAEEEAKEKAVESALETLQVLEEELKGKKFFGGEAIGYLDLVVGWIPRWLQALEEVGEMKLLDAERFPCLHAWAENWVDLPVIKESLPPLEAVVEYFHASKKYRLSLAAKMGEGEVKLFRTWSSPFGLRITWALKLKGIQYENIDEDLSNKSPLLLMYNPIHKKIPVLLHNGKAIAESAVILEYIDETWKENPILPQCPHERAMARFIAKFGDDKCTAALWRVVTTQGKEQEEAISTSMECLKTLEEWLKGKKYFNGDSIGYADIMLGWIANLVRVVEEILEMKLIDEERFPLLFAWIENLSNLPAIKDSWPPHDKLVSKYRAIRDSLMVE